MPGNSQNRRQPYLLLNRALNRNVNAPGNWKRPSDSLSVASSSRRLRRPPAHTCPEFCWPPCPEGRRPIFQKGIPSVRRSFNGTDNHIRFLQQRMPTLEHTTKSFCVTGEWVLLKWPFGSCPWFNGSAPYDRFWGYEGHENLKASALYAHSRLRSSLVFKPTSPEQQEVNSCTTDSSNSTALVPREVTHLKESDTPGAQLMTDKPSEESTPKFLGAARGTKCIPYRVLKATHQL